MICWPPRTTMMRQSRADLARRLFEIAGLGDLLVVDGEDDVALLETDAGGGGALGELGHHHALGVGVDPQFVGQRGRDVGHLGALERRARGQDDLVAAGIGRGLERNVDLDGLAGALHVDLRAAAERTGGEAIIKAVGIVDGLAVDRDHQIGQFQPCPRRRAARRDIGDQRAGGNAKPQRLGDLGRHRLQPGAEPRPLHRLAAALGGGDDDAHHVGGDRKADALRAAGAREDRGVDADELAGHVDQRAAGIAGIDGGIGLDEELVVGDADLGARQRRDDAVGDGLPDAEGIADRQHDVADQQLIGIGEIQRREFLLAVLDPQHREIGAAVLEHDLGLEFALVGQRDLDLVGALDDVVVGHDEAGRIHHHARSQRALHLLRLLAGHAEEAAEDRIVEQRIAVLHHLGGIDVDHRRLHPLHDRRVGQLQLHGRIRHAAVLRHRRGGRGRKDQQCRDDTNSQHEKIPWGLMVRI